jgi:hypothetical protein
MTDEINDNLNKKKKEKYFENITLLYSFIENVLKWLVYANALWTRSRSPKKITTKEIKEIRNYCKKLNFFGAISVAYIDGLIDLKLYKRIHEIRKERNMIIHKFWILQRRGDLRVFRKKLEKLANIANSLVGVFNRLTRRIGVDEIYEIAL